MKHAVLRSLGIALSFGLLACTTPDRPPFALAHPDHPDGWRRVDLEHDDDHLTQWRLLLPREARVPPGAGLRAETYKTVLDRDYSLQRFYADSVALEQRSCPGVTSTLLEEQESRYLYEATAPRTSRCWGYQLVRLEMGKRAIHALAVYAHAPPSEADREFWLAVLQTATFDP